MKKRLHELAGWYFSRQAAPYWIVLIFDCLIVLVCEIVSYALVHSLIGYIHANYLQVLLSYILILPGFLVGFRVFHTYSGIVRFSNSVDLMRLIGGLGIGAVLSFLLHLLFTRANIVYTVDTLSLIVGFLLSTMGCSIWRVSVRFLYDTFIYARNQQRVFVYGVHEGGESLAHSIMSDSSSPYVLSGFVSDNIDDKNHYMMGVKIYHVSDRLVEVMRAKHIRALFVSPLRNDALRENQPFLTALLKNGIKVMMQPAEHEWDGKSPLGTEQLHEVQIEDLLPRDKISVDLDAIGALIKDKVVMVTGAAGSIGSEMARQIAKFGPKHMILVDQAETPMHDVRLHMHNHYAYIPCETIVSSISNQTKMEAIFKQYRPEYVFHAAAYKHVPMMEDNPSEAVQNNVYGTRVIADLAVKYGTRKFVMISTDKAVNPTNVMGCSKRICEIYCQALNKAIQEGTCPIQLDAEAQQKLGIDKPITQFVTTRFGNVLGSNGSVIPIFREQIKKGGPVTVTHPDIIRFFMLIPEACRLVLEAGTMGHGGEIFVFDMGKPVRIADLAQRMIDLSGAKNVEIKFTGLRDGEKLFEEVLNDQEQTRPTPHPKIMVSAVREYPYDLALKNEEELYKLSFTYDDMAVVAKMKEIVPEYKSRQSKYEVLDKD